VESVISDLRDMSASGFSASGFANPAISVTVISQDGKHTEKVQIAKSGDHYVAQRDNDPALYELSSTSVEGLLKAAQELKPATTQTAQKKP
jgi:hypothetical protein